ncbi:uncharacterized protein [Epargyreus clarus]|uniref:uncharacterized protein isoform X1 n=1 Tax=Epargyreus clarus TaxID=520877 RepID=UPI003C2CFB92
MMDLKEIIKWFIPCFHVLVTGRLVKMDCRLTILFLFLLFNLCASFAANVNSVSDYRLRHSLVNNTKKLNVDYDNVSFVNSEPRNDPDVGSTELEDGSVGRTFGRPFKKMLQALVPLAFQMGMAATWAVVAALVGIKTLGVTLLILKLLLLAGAFKIMTFSFGALPTNGTRLVQSTVPMDTRLSPLQQFGSFFAHKSHGHGWEAQAHNKEIHLHIHNGQLGHGTEEHIPISPWSREGIQNADTKQFNMVYDPYSRGPQTVSTPYGHYMKIEPDNPAQNN